MSISVVNRRTHSPEPCDVYIGRGSRLGNPFSSKPSTYDVTRVESREEAVRRYEAWLRATLRDRDSDAFRALLSAVRVYEEHGRLNLVCYCAPKACHGDVLRDVLAEVT